MKALLSDLMVLVKRHWKTILVIVLVIYLLFSYSDIKQGILDGWSQSGEGR
jgi:hypothetical protein